MFTVVTWQSLRSRALEWLQKCLYATLTVWQKHCFVCTKKSIRKTQKAVFFQYFSLTTLKCGGVSGILKNKICHVLFCFAFDVAFLSLSLEWGYWTKMLKNFVFLLFWAEWVRLFPKLVVIIIFKKYPWLILQTNGFLKV